MRFWVVIMPLAALVLYEMAYYGSLALCVASSSLSPCLVFLALPQLPGLS